MIWGALENIKFCSSKIYLPTSSLILKNSPHSTSPHLRSIAQMRTISDTIPTITVPIKNESCAHAGQFFQNRHAGTGGEASSFGFGTFFGLRDRLYTVSRRMNFLSGSRRTSWWYPRERYIYSLQRSLSGGSSGLEISERWKERGSYRDPTGNLYD